ncbi:hypothetical protein HOO68_06740 [Candidatus Gracilibacteria bacterium]|nr:hypothetical protein [Candidatus Gracilibacteria bacterium]
MNSVDAHSEKIQTIHPINAEYLLSSEPHRLYAHSSNGNLLELAVERFTNRTEELLYGHGGIIAIGSCNSASGISGNSTHILRPNGDIIALHSEGGIIEGIEWNMYYMLLNPVGLDNWVSQDIGKFDEANSERVSFGGNIGIQLDDANSRPRLEKIFDQARSQYLRTIGR